MKKIATVLTLALLAVVTMGFGSCTSIKVPANTVKFETPHGSLTLVHPQNTSMTNVHVMFGTNGTVEATIGSLHTENSPDVIDKVAAGEVAKINAIGTQVQGAFEAGAKMAGAAAGAAAK